MDLTFGSPVNTAIGTTSDSDATTSQYFASTADPQPPNQIQIYGGILLRTIRRQSDAKVISGPSVLVDEVLRATRAATIAQLVKDAWDGDTAAWPSTSAELSDTRDSYLRLVPATRSSSTSTGGGVVDSVRQIYSSPRIGLDLSNSSIPTSVEKALKHASVHFVGRRYRYFVEPHLLVANGRGHTVYGVLKGLPPSIAEKG